jgi:glyoxylase-like metal-dependent hydrolase (beta-lactamase superfamily II)
MQVTGLDQQRSWSTDDLPPVEEVRPGLWSIPVPIPNNPLRYVLSYGFETSAGIVLMDPGWHAESAYQRLIAGLQHAGFGLGDVKGVLVTHVHPDHYGLAPRLREETGAWVALHAADAEVIRRASQRQTYLAESLMGDLLEAGAPPENVQEAAEQAVSMVRMMPRSLPDREIGDGQRLDVPGWNVTAIWTPGHSPGHVCFYDHDRELLFSGDHVLPRISSHIGFHNGSDEADPLGDFLASLEKLIARGEPEEILPAHQWRFVGLIDRATRLIEHHRERLDEVIAILQSGEASLWDIASRLHWYTPWSDFNTFLRHAALSETRAHLVYLELRGAVVSRSARPRVYALV